MIKELNKKNLISRNCEELLTGKFGEVPSSLFLRMLSGKRMGKKYPKELKAFAMTLQFFSSKAYLYVRRSFGLNLPHPSQIRHWYTKVPTEPGFTDVSFNAIRSQVGTSSTPLFLALMMDEMAIKKHISWDGKRYRGFVDVGAEADINDSTPVAREVLVLMAVCVNSNWRLPLGYFLVDGLSGSERANIIKVCIRRLEETGAHVISLTCDGPSCHMAMLKELGANLNPRMMQAYFSHPLDEKQTVNIFLDVCHMLKLVRNTFSEWGILKDLNGQQINWNYVTELQKLQEKEGLRLANKLQRDHIMWKQQKMKVNLAAQTLSCSVADAISYCNNYLKMAQFKGSEATVAFIKLFDRLFDILNSRNPLAHGFKSPMRETNKSSWEPFLDYSQHYILGLRDTTGRLLVESPRKTGFIGFLACINSTKACFYQTVNNGPMKYLLTYKFSQDHLELFFCAIRSAGGWNNNPTVQQFIAAYKRLLWRTGSKMFNGNCCPQDNTVMLDLLESQSSIGEGPSLSSVSLARKYDLIERQPSRSDHDYVDMPNSILLSQYKYQVVAYISGYVAKSLQDDLMCKDCVRALDNRDHAVPSFIRHKDRGGLFKPSLDVIRICLETERCVQRMLVGTEGMLPQGRGITDAIAGAVLSNLQMKSIFKNMEKHMYDSEVTENHVFDLVKKISKRYCNIRLHHLGKEKNSIICQDKIRKRLTKVIIFKNQ